MVKKGTIGEMQRFVVVGIVATAIHYAIYWVLQRYINVSIAYTIGYVVSFIANYCLSARFTFREKTTARNGAGFIGAHVCNYLLQITFLNLFLWLGLSRALAPFAVYAIAVPVNFVLVRFAFKKLKKKEGRREVVK